MYLEASTGLHIGYSVRATLELKLFYPDSVVELFVFVTACSIIIERVAEEIIRLVASVCVSDRWSVCVRLLWALSCLNSLTYDLDFWHEGLP